MEISLIMAISANGKITKGKITKSSLWTSGEDRKNFLKILKAHDTLVMGRKTYDVEKKNILPSSKRLKIIMTKNPKKYFKESIPRQLEFSSMDPKKLMDNLKKNGTKKSFDLWRKHHKFYFSQKQSC